MIAPVVYVEDNINNQRLMQKMLGKVGLQVEVYDTAEAAYPAILQNRPLLIFVDVHLKTRATGMDLVQWLRADGLTMPIIVVTVFNMLADRKKALEAGCNDHLVKPYEMRDLFALIEKHLGITPPTSCDPPPPPHP